MSKIIKSKELNVFTCLIVEKNNSSNDKNQIIIVLNVKNIKIFRLIKSKGNSLEENKVILLFLIL